MTKMTITRIWIGGLIALLGGLFIGGVCIWLLRVFGGHWEPGAAANDYTFVPTINAFFWTVIAAMTVGFLVAAAGGVAQLAAWIGALVNTYRLEDKVWFIALLVAGVLGLSVGLIGFAVMVAYLVAGPDSTALQPTGPASPLLPSAFAQAGA